MTISRSFQTLLRNSNSRSVLSYYACSTALPSTLPCVSSVISLSLNQSFSSPFHLSSTHSRFLSPFSRWVPVSGPLFLSSPPSQLLQSATPLYMRGTSVAEKVESLSSKLLQTKTKTNHLVNESVGEVGSKNDQKEFTYSGETKGVYYDSYVNLPNMISMSRMVSAPLIGWMIINEWYLSAFVATGVSGATDWLDGYVARKMGINSVVGSYLDPLADKVLIGCVAVAMVKKDLLQPWLVGIVVFRDVGLVVGALYQRANTLGWKWKSWSEFTNLDGMHRHKVEPLFISKVNTVFQLALVAAALLQPEFGSDQTQLCITYLTWLVASTTAASTVAYGKQYLKNCWMLALGGPSKILVELASSRDEELTNLIYKARSKVRLKHEGCESLGVLTGVALMAFSPSTESENIEARQNISILRTGSSSHNSTISLERRQQ